MRGRPAFSLVELLAIIATFGVAVLVGSSVLVAAFKIQKTTQTSVEALSQRAALADLFRADVARASAAPDRFETDTAGPTCLVLELPGGGHLVYRWQMNRLERRELPGGRVQLLPAGPRGTSVEFVRTAGSRLLTLRLVLPQAGGTTRPLEFSAALGGDLR